MTENPAFDLARMRVLGEDRESLGIGTLSEKTVHKILKFYIEPDEGYHEIPCMGSVADILREDNIYEIQTREAYRLIPKLEKFLKEKSVTVVLPVTVTKYIKIFDKRTGEIGAPKKSPKRETVYTAFREIYKLRRFLCTEGFKIKLLFIEAEEYKIIGENGRARKSDRIPTKLVDEITLSETRDYLSLVPPGLSEQFGSADFARAAKINKASIFYVMRVLTLLGITECIGKNGRSNIYKLYNIKSEVLHQ